MLPVALESPPRYPAFRIAGWQLLATGLAAAIAGWFGGWPGVLSSLLGGLVNVFAGMVFALLARTIGPPTAGGTIHAMVRAEAGKLIVILLQLSLMLTLYKGVVLGAFFSAFVATLLVTQAAILFRD